MAIHPVFFRIALGVAGALLIWSGPGCVESREPWSFGVEGRNTPFGNYRLGMWHGGQTTILPAPEIVTLPPGEWTLTIPPPP